MRRILLCSCLIGAACVPKPPVAGSSGPLVGTRPPLGTLSVNSITPDAKDAALAARIDRAKARADALRRTKALTPEESARVNASIETARVAEDPVSR